MRIHSPPSLNVENLELRQIERTDIDAWYRYLHLPAVFEHTSWNLRSSIDLQPLFSTYESPLPDSARRLAIVEKDKDSLIGTIGFHSISTQNKTAEITYDLSPQYWKRGIAATAINVLTAWSFETYGFVRVQATALESNERSQRALLKAGYQHEGLLRAFRMVRGQPGNFNVFARLASIDG